MGVLCFAGMEKREGRRAGGWRWEAGDRRQEVGGGRVKAGGRRQDWDWQEDKEERDDEGSTDKDGEGEVGGGFFMPALSAWILTVFWNPKESKNTLI